MECNKDEASRAKEIAEKKFTAKDIVNSKKFALKAQNLYPALEGINQMLATLDVYLSAEKRINGEADWYSILNVDPRSDEDTLRKQFRKLALALHPDKNKSIGADGAFKLISEAWSVLSDKAKRLAYDSKSKATIYQKVSTSTGRSSAKPWVNGFNPFTKYTTTNVKTQKSTTQSGTTSAIASQKVKSITFWTVCYGCKIKYEYPRAYLNHNLLCPSCNNAFLAVETPPPPIASKMMPLKILPQRKNLNNQAGDKDFINRVKNTSKSSKSGSYDQNTFRWTPFSKSSSASPATQSVTMVQQVDEQEREEGPKSEEPLVRKHHAFKKTSDSSLKGSSPLSNRKRGINDISTSALGNGGTSAMEIGTQAPNSSVFLQSTATKNVINASTNPSTIVDVPNLLMKKARQEITKKLNEWRSSSPTSTPSKEWNRGKNLNVKKDKLLEDSDMDHHNILDLKNGNVVREAFSESSGVNGDTKIFEPKSIDVPDSDFHDFDEDRTENCFGENQVWAAYDDDDGMPRYYAMIHSVRSLNPFKMQMSWLNSKSNSEFGPLNWISSGFTKTCGDFRLGKYEKYRLLNSFSHKVKFTKGAKGTIQIYPMKGDVWALYKNWKPDWNELISDEVIHSYEMVEVLEDYNEEIGVTIIPLEKVAGFRTVFRRCLGPPKIRTIPREEMFRFSHSVPSYLLTGKEAPNAPKGCRELDPAASAIDVLQGPTERNEIDIVGRNEHTMEENTDSELGNVNNRRQYSS